MDLSSYVPQDKFDSGAIQRATELGFPALNQIIPDLLIWLQDINWPVASDVIALLATCGTEIVPHVQAILESEDSIWKYWILVGLYPQLSEDTQKALIPSIAKLIASPSPSDLAEEVLEIAKSLATHHTVSR